MFAAPYCVVKSPPMNRDFDGTEFRSDFQCCEETAAIMSGTC